jgi:YD repeat-containing protein
MSTPTFVTQATNFTSALGGGVDPRTGLYTFAVHLGKLTGNRGAGPVLPLTLRYSPLNRANVGIGIGWTLGLSTLEFGKKPVICVSTGEQYGLTKTGNTYAVAQQRLQSFKFEQQDASHYWIAHKSGDRELIEIRGDSGYVSKLYSAAGHALNLNWDTTLATPRLIQVTDAAGHVLFDAPNGYGANGTVFSLFPGSTDKTTGEAYSVVLASNNGLVQSVTIEARGCEDQKWTFTNASVDQKNIWGQWITAVTGPGNYQDTVEYSKNHALPPGGPSAFMPCVGKFTRTPGGGQTQLISNYTYSDFNFLGGGATNIRWYDDRDSLMVLPFDPNYCYTSTEIELASVESGPDVTTTRTYNAYHLQQQVDVTSDARTQTTVSTYGGIKPNAVLAEQKAWYQFPSAKSVNWNGGAAENSSFEWDDFGNPLKKTDPDGLITQWTYYSESGVIGKCPPEPNGFRRFAEWKLINPGKVKAADWVDGAAPVRQKNYTYDYAQAAPGSDKKLVLGNFEQHVSAVSADSSGVLTSPTTLSETRYRYWTSDIAGSDQYDAGRLYHRATTHYANDGTGNSYDNTDDYTYTYFDKNDQHFPFGLQTNRQSAATGVDGKTLIVSDTHIKSTFTDRVWKEIDVQQNSTSYVYDRLGRPLQRIMDPGKAAYTNILTYTYSIDNSGATPFQVTQKDIRGNRVRYSMDGLRRPYKKEVNAVDIDGADSEKFYELSSKQFDGMGRLWKSTASDVAYDSSNRKIPYALTSTHTYDGWGHPKKTAYSNGVLEFTTYDPIAKSVKTWLGSSTSTLTSGSHLTHYDYNFSQKPYRVERYNSAPSSACYSVHYTTYDGLHRVRSETEEVAAGATMPPTTSYEYDHWDRAFNTTLPDKTVMVRSYSPDSPEKRVTNIQITQSAGDLNTLVSPGVRQFDALGRVTQSYLGASEGERFWTYGYGNAWDTRPTTATDPTAITRTYSYSPELGEAVESVTTSGSAKIEQNFGYDKHAGLLTSANASDGDAWTYDTFTSGRLQSESSTGGNGSTMSYIYTVAGAPYSYTHIDGATQTIIRDKYGRVSQITDGIVLVTLSYDALNRRIGWTATQGQHTLSTDITLDDFGRETKRVIRDNKTQKSWSITQAWQANDLLSTVTFSKGSQQVRVESYTYDSRNRLINWSVNPYYTTEFPCDRFGNQIWKQSFVVDPLNNITQVTTSFTNPKATNVAVFNFEDEYDPCRLTGGTNTHPSYRAKFKVTYDKAGRITDDGMGTTFTYDELGRVRAAASELTKLSGTYTYDAHNRLASQTIDSDPIKFYYRANSLVNLVQGTNQSRLFQASIVGAVAQTNIGEDAGSWLLGTNQLGSVLNASDGESTDTRVYSAYGEEAINPKKAADDR